MAHTVSSDQIVYAFSRLNPAVLRVPSDSEVILHTCDCFTDQLKTPEDRLESLDWDRINPATGPVFVEGARPGDVLKVEVRRIETAARGILATGKDLGLLGARLEGMPSRMVRVESNRVWFDDRVSFPANRMIGVIGVAPAGEPVSCGTPGAHGGNMDTKVIAEGATLYLPVAADGALFGLGDLHAAMGDGEIGVSGVEVAGRVTVHLSVVPQTHLPGPFVEDADWVYALHSAPTYDEALQGAVEALSTFLGAATGLPPADRAMLMSAVGQAQVSQVVDPLKTARYAFPKAVLRQYPSFDLIPNLQEAFRG